MYHASRTVSILAQGVVRLSAVNDADDTRVHASENAMHRPRSAKDGAVKIVVPSTIPGWVGSNPYVSGTGRELQKQACVERRSPPKATVQRSRPRDLNKAPAFETAGRRVLISGFLDSLRCRDRQRVGSLLSTSFVTANRFTSRSSPTNLKVYSLSTWVLRVMPP